MNAKEYIENMKTIQQRLLDFIENEDDKEENYENILEIITDQKIQENQHDLKTLLYLITKIANNHHQQPHFFTKIEKILTNFKDEMKKFYSNWEIFKIFKRNKRILLFLIEEKIITIDKSIFNRMLEEKYRSEKYIEYFLPEVKSFIKSEMKNKSKTEELTEDIEDVYDLILKIPDEEIDEFNEKRKNGQNDGYIYKLIQNDSIEEFIVYINQKDYSIENYVIPSIFETNPFLLKNKRPTLIEYATFYGSNQIFKFLHNNEIELSDTLWIYAIHGDNAEVIHLLDENDIQPPELSYEKCINESIKCHHNHIFNYIANNFLYDNYTNDEIYELIDFENDFDDNIVSNSFRYYNFLFFPNEIDEIKTSVFGYACEYDYFSLAKILFNTGKININARIGKAVLIFNEIFEIQKKIFF
ncbi:hypothetical protein M9Y10_019523 [Tritrichomonas musculus]|uniref:DUF3447 domain-containing protein n=1 Tax=Tritrichomonas musculus TaxID=1915356 RepID=A0ABR2HHH9_9EUKA